MKFGLGYIWTIDAVICCAVSVSAFQDFMDLLLCFLQVRNSPFAVVDLRVLPGLHRPRIGSNKKKSLGVQLLTCSRFTSNYFKGLFLGFDILTARFQLVFSQAYFINNSAQYATHLSCFTLLSIIMYIPCTFCQMYMIMYLT